MGRTHDALGTPNRANGRTGAPMDENGKRVRKNAPRRRGGGKCVTRDTNIAQVGKMCPVGHKRGANVGKEPRGLNTCRKKN